MRRHRCFLQAGLVGLTIVDLLLLGQHRMVSLGPARPLVEQSPVLAALAREPRGTRIVDGSRNLPMSRFDPGDLPMGKTLALICRSGHRSRTALARARAAGRDDIRHFAGGMLQWGMAGGDVEA